MAELVMREIKIELVWLGKPCKACGCLPNGRPVLEGMAASATQDDNIRVRR